MKITSQWGLRLLALYLVLVGLMMLIPALSVIPGIVVAIVALAAGVLIFIGR